MVKAIGKGTYLKNALQVVIFVFEMEARGSIYENEDND